MGLKDTDEVIIDFNQPAIREAEPRMSRITRERLAEVRTMPIGEMDPKLAAYLLAAIIYETGIKIRCSRVPKVQ